MVPCPEMSTSRPWADAKDCPVEGWQKGYDREGRHSRKIPFGQEKVVCTDPDIPHSVSQQECPLVISGGPSEMM